MTGAWLRRAGRIMASNQRLLFFPIALQVGVALLMLPVTIASHDGVTFDVFARDAASPDQRTLDLIEASSTSTGTYIAIAVAFVVSVVLSAWLTGAFIRSVSDGALRWWPGRRAFALLAVLYGVTGLFGLGFGVLAANGDGSALLALFALLAIAIPLTFADYAIIFEDRTLAGAIVRSVRIWRQRPSQGLLTLVTFLLATDVVFALFIDKMQDSEGVFPGFFGALLLVQALVAYASDCLLIALMLETPDVAATGREPAHQE